MYDREYSWEDFKKFVIDACGDPVNRILDVVLRHERIRQQDNQTVEKFALELEELEDQLGDYTEAQKVRHLLAKLAAPLRDALVKYHDIPTTRQALVRLAARVESVDRKGHQPPKHKRGESEGIAKGPP